MITYKQLGKLNQTFESLDQEAALTLTDQELKDRIVDLDKKLKLVNESKKEYNDECKSYVKKIKDQKDFLHDVRSGEMPSNKTFKLMDGGNQ